MNILRKLSVSEKLYAEMNLSITAFTVLRGKLTAEITHKAFEILLNRHPLLNCIILKKEEDYFFVKRTQTKIPIQILENVSDDKQKYKISQQELNTPLNANNELFRITLIFNCPIKDVTSTSEVGLNITLHHSIADARSSLLLQKEFYSLCDKIIQNHEFNLTNLPPLFHSIESYFASDIKDINKSEFAESLYQKSLLFENTKTLPVSLDNEKTPALTQEMIVVNLSEIQTNAVVDKCKEHGASVNSGIIASHLIALRKMLNSSQEKLTLCCGSTYDLRKWITPPLEYEYLFSASTGFLDYYPINPQDTLWQLAKFISGKIQANITTKMVLQKFLAIEQVSKKPPQPVALYISNIGKISLENDYEKIKVLNLYYGQSVKTPFPQIGISTFNKRMSLVYLYTNPLLERKLINELADNSFNYFSI